MPARAEVRAVVRELMQKGWRTTQQGWEIWWIGAAGTESTGTFYPTQRSAVALAHGCGAADVQVLPLVHQPVSVSDG